MSSFLCSSLPTELGHTKSSHIHYALGDDPPVASSLTTELTSLAMATTACHGPQPSTSRRSSISRDEGCSRRNDGTEGSWKNTASHRAEDIFQPLLDSTIYAARAGDPTSCLQGNLLPWCRSCDRQVSASASAYSWELNPGAPGI